MILGLAVKVPTSDVIDEESESTSKSHGHVNDFFFQLVMGRVGRDLTLRSK